MAHLWEKRGSDWAVAPLGEEAICVLADDGPTIAEGDRRDGVLLLRAGSGQWVLLCDREAGVRVNGGPPVSSIVALRNRDEIIRPAGNTGRLQRYFFSTEGLAQAVPFPDGADEMGCARCGQPLETGDLAVQCPACASWHHAGDALPCWQYDDHCAVCDQPTDLEAGYRWVPEEF